VQQPWLGDLVQDRRVARRDGGHLAHVGGVRPGVLQVGGGVIEEAHVRLAPAREARPGHPAEAVAAYLVDAAGDGAELAEERRPLRARVGRQPVRRGYPGQQGLEEVVAAGDLAGEVHREGARQQRRDGRQVRLAGMLAAHQLPVQAALPGRLGCDPEDHRLAGAEVDH
jgi:hypothetical protein